MQGTLDCFHLIPLKNNNNDANKSGVEVHESVQDLKRLDVIWAPIKISDITGVKIQLLFYLYSSSIGVQIYEVCALYHYYDY